MGPAVVTSIMTPHMRKMMKQLMAGKEDTGLNNIPVTLELSPKHHIVTTLHTIKEANETVARIAVEQLYDNACIAAGTLDDPRTLLTRLNKVLEMFIYQGAGFDYSRNEYITKDCAEAGVNDHKEQHQPALSKPPEAIQTKRTRVPLPSLRSCGHPPMRKLTRSQSRILQPMLWGSFDMSFQKHVVEPRIICEKP